MNWSSYVENVSDMNKLEWQRISCIVEGQWFEIIRIMIFDDYCIIKFQYSATTTSIVILFPFRISEQFLDLIVQANRLEVWIKFFDIQKKNLDIDDGL